MKTFKCSSTLWIFVSWIVSYFFGSSFGAMPLFISPAADGSSTLSIPEGPQTLPSIYTLLAIDSHTNGTISYFINSQSPGSNFQLTTNALQLSRLLDYETDPTSYNLTLEARKTSTGQNSTTSMVIFITDINDEVPVIQGTFTTSIEEEKPVGTTVPIPYTANDQDAGDVLTYSITGTDNNQLDLLSRKPVLNGNEIDFGSTYFQIDSGSGVISIRQVIDYDSGLHSLTFTLVVKDSATPPHTATQLITVTITNINDNTPIFAPAVYYATVVENEVAGVSITPVSVTDGDTTDIVTVSIQSGDDVVPKFTVISNVIQTTSSPTDFEVLGGQNYMYSLVVIGVDSHLNSTTGTATVYVTVVNVNEHTPTWASFNPAYSSSTPYFLDENVPAGTSVVTINATDVDSGPDGEIKYSIQAVTLSGTGTSTGLFHLDETTGILTVSTNTLDRDIATGGSEHVNVTVRAEDKGTISHSADRIIHISLNDVNDNIPVCPVALYAASVAENVPRGYSIFTVTATDDDATAANSVVTYSISSGNGLSYFSINPSTGDVSVSNNLDYELATGYDIQFGPDFDLPCSKALKPFTVDDSTQESLNSAITPDARALRWRAKSIHQSGICLAIVLKSRSNYILTVLATDQGNPQNTGTITHTVAVTDINDNTPVIQGTYDTTVSENNPLNTVVFTVSATDADDVPNNIISYALTNGNMNSDFYIDGVSGIIQVRQPLDREMTAVYNLEITVTDSGVPPLSSSATATITILDVNDNVPVFSMSHYSFSVSEAAPSSTSVGGVNATDADEGINAMINYTVAYFFTGDSRHFSLNDITGVLSTFGSLDREVSDTYVLIVRATDKGSVPLATTATVSVTIADNNDNTPVFDKPTYIGYTTENLALGTNILTVTVTDKDIGLNADISLTVDTATTAGVRADIYIGTDSNTFNIYVKQAIDRETDSSFIFSLIATDRGTPPLSSTSTINITVLDVNDNPPVFLPNFYSVEVAYNDDCQGTVATLTVSDSDEGINAEIFYTFSQNNYSNIFSLNRNTGDITISGSAVEDFKYLLYVSASDRGSPSMTSVVNATIRVDSYTPNSIILNYYMNINCSTFTLSQSTFLTQLTSLYQAIYVSPQAKKWCSVESSPSTCIVRVYVIKDDKADELKELSNAKAFLTNDESFAVTSADSMGTPVTALTSSAWMAFNITKVEKYYAEPDPDSTESWFESTTGIIVMSTVGAVALVAIATGFSLAFYYKYKRPANPVKRQGKRNMPRKIYPNNTIEKKTDFPRVSVDDKNYVIKNRQFDGRAVDPDTGRLFEYNTKSGDRSWIKTPDGDPNLNF